MIRRGTLINHAITCFLAFVLCWMEAGHARADEAAQNAFYFVDKRDWTNALGHARKSNEPLLTMLVSWLAMQDASYEMPPQLIAAFITQKPDWPDMDRLRVRFEQSYAASEAVADRSTMQWFTEYPPISGAGKWMQAKAMLALNQDRTQVEALIRDAWVNGDFPPNVEQEIIAKAGALLTPEMHIKRAERLVWDGQFSAARRMSAYIPKATMDMLQARIALETLDKKAPSLFAKLPASAKNNLGITYSRIVWRSRKDDGKGAMELLKNVTGNVPYPEKWWRYSEPLIRDAIDKGNFKTAHQLLLQHGLTEGVAFAEAMWLRGWLELEFFGKAKEAYHAFDTLYRGVNFAISKSRAAYWAGRAAEKLKDSKTARSWFENAAFYPTTFYGQLAYARIAPNKPLPLMSSPAIDTKAYAAFKQTDVAKVIALCMKYDHQPIANRFIKDMIDNANSKQKMLHIALLSKELKGKSLGVKAAKRALQYNVLLGDIAYPKLTRTFQVLEGALTHAITRQESEFDPWAESGSGALGMMQLLPSTAKEVARKNGISYGQASLYNEEYNTELGSTFLASLVRAFDGNYVLAIASYNAGPGRVRQWISAFGMPEGNTEQVINWIEKIPYGETRNYVQRVLENLQVYRSILGGANAPLEIERDLKR